MIRSLPKRYRRECIPLPETLDALLPRLAQTSDRLPSERPGEAGEWIYRLPRRSLRAALSKALAAVRPAKPPGDAWRPEAVPDFLRLNFRVIDENGACLAMGRDAEALRAELQSRAQAAFAQADKETYERRNLVKWDFGPLPDRVELGRPEARCFATPALVDEGDSAALKLFETPEEAAEAHRDGLRRLFAAALGAQGKYARKNIPLSDEACLYHNGVGGQLEALHIEIIDAAIEHIFLAGEEPVRDGETFDRRIREKRIDFARAVYDLGRAVDQILTLAHAVERALSGKKTRLPPAAQSDMREQLAWLVRPGFVLAGPYGQIFQIPRYLEALQVRIERAGHAPDKDAKKRARIDPWWQRCRRQLLKLPEGVYPGPALTRLRWAIEEYRVSLHAQKEVGATSPVSEKRLRELWSEVEAERHVG